MTDPVTFDFWAHAQQVTATIVSLLIIAGALYKPFQWLVVNPIKNKLDQIEQNSNDNRKQWEAIESQGEIAWFSASRSTPKDSTTSKRANSRY